MPRDLKVKTFYAFKFQLSELSGKFPPQVAKHAVTVTAACVAGPSRPGFTSIVV
jgi:hypothetical protein